MKFEIGAEGPGRVHEFEKDVAEFMNKGAANQFGPTYTWVLQNSKHFN